MAPERLDYILEIYANIENLEYDRFLIDRRKRLASRVELGTSLPDCFQGELYPFQIDGYSWMQDLYAVPLGGLLADEMGLGKTVQVIAFMSWLLERKCLRPSLIVVPLALVENWESELMRFLPGITVLKHMGPQRIRRSEVLEKIDVVITTYGTLSREDELMLGKVSWQLMVCDESPSDEELHDDAGQGVQGYESRNALGSHWYPGREQPRRALVDSPITASRGSWGSYREFRHAFELPLERALDLKKRQEVENRLRTLPQAHLSSPHQGGNRQRAAAEKSRYGASAPWPGAEKVIPRCHRGPDVANGERTRRSLNRDTQAHCYLRPSGATNG